MYILESSSLKQLYPNFISTCCAERCQKINFLGYKESKFCHICSVHYEQTKINLCIASPSNQGVIPPQRSVPQKNNMLAFQQKTIKSMVTIINKGVDSKGERFHRVTNILEQQATIQFSTYMYVSHSNIKCTPACPTLEKPTQE